MESQEHGHITVGVKEVFSEEVIILLAVEQYFPSEKKTTSTS